jgi:hypothetical protein
VRRSATFVGHRAREHENAEAESNKDVTPLHTTTLLKGEQQRRLCPKYASRAGASGIDFSYIDQSASYFAECAELEPFNLGFSEQREKST